KYPVQQPDVFSGLRSHVATLHGMIEHGSAFGVTEQELRTADRNVTIWVYTADKNLGPFVDTGMLDADRSRFLKMPNGIQTPVIEPVPRAQLGIPDDAFVLCCVSRAIPDKGWSETIAAVERARELSGRDIRLVLVGNGPVYDEYLRRGVPAFVHLVGFSENSAGHYAGADMGIMLTRFRSESFPLTIVDCLFAGKPYIATDVGDIRNMLTSPDGVAGEVIELQDWQVPVETAAEAIARFVTDVACYEAAKARVPRIVGRFRIDHVASLYVDLFRRAPEQAMEAVAEEARVA
ncbi:glycosyltransferase family 4 protein, partial [Ramlibacter sp. USB13]